MKIWIMRHGEAGFNALTDSQRKLTEAGKKMAYQQGIYLGKQLNNEQNYLDKIIVSPYLRTQETWGEVEKGIQAVGFNQSFANVIETWDGITPGGSPEQVSDYLTFLESEGAKHVLLISHLPLVFDLVQHLTQYQQSVHFYPAVLAEIEWNGMIGKLLTVEKP